MANPMNRPLKIFIALFCALIILFILYMLLVTSWSFSTGERAGYVQKFSKKGWICKTWEGEMVLVGPLGVPMEKFYFSTRDDELAKKINQLVGQKVILAYEQKKGIPTTCLGETEYRPADIQKTP